MDINWNTGIPQIKGGTSKSFWCAIIGYDGTTRYCVLDYLNKYVMDVHDDMLEIPDCCHHNEEKDEFEWTGWFEPYCEHCEVHWTNHLKVLAFAELPENYAAKEAK